ncbi:Outer membrane protein OmpA [Microbispora rosea]|uniref:Outer membrane protein OmpA n=1 Tax=Microbispora rosea TaxID=58117 RepID=A0A1N7FJ44_9ACTN|nr:OmpA family protein [Microbispora rosea]SIS00246.1 Outer membrane protein OmpA [Microbispora rosea]
MAYRWRSRELTVSVTMVAVLTVSGCGALGGPRAPSSGGVSSAPPRPSVTSAAASLVKEGWFGPTSPLHARVEMRGVERLADRSVLRFTVTSLEDEARHTGNSFGTAAGDFGSYRIPLVDPVGGKVYHPLTDQVGTLGSKPGYYEPGVRYETVVYYPPIPAGVRTVTAITAGTAGEFTGVPVVDGTGSGGAMSPTAAPGSTVSPTAAPGGTVSPTAASGSTPQPGTTVSWPVREPAGQVTSSVQDLYGITESAEKTTIASGGDETVGLRTDVLFAFDSDRLTARARAVLDDVAKETREKADPARPPVLVEGHTDGKGTHAYNMALSLRRAQAVRRELQARLGGAYRFRTTGKGETEPVAREGGTDDEEARARNRRVEVSYRVKQPTGGSTASETAGTRADEPTTSGGRPAPFHADDGETVAGRTSTGRPSGQRLRIDVKPFYRDGAYLVAVFDIVNLGPGNLGAGTGYGGDIAYIGGWYTGFSVVDPASRTVYRAVRMGPDDPRGPDDYVDPGWATFNVEPGTGNRGFFYVPAPPPGVTSVTFDAGPFGRFDHVPVR